MREYLEGITVTDAAKHLGVTRTALSRILNGKAGVSPEMALKLEEAFGATTAETWLAMPSKYDLWQAKQHRRVHVQPFASV